MKSIKKPIVIVGAGFGGITVAINLKKLNPSLPILIVDSAEKFIFKPLMYEILSEEIPMWEAAPEYSNLFSNLGITFLRNCLTKINLEENILEFSDDLKIEYQSLVLCTGSLPNNFAVKGVDENCYFFNNLNDLIKLKSILQKIQNNYERKDLYIIGAGPSGVEIACKISDLYKDEFNITLIERSNEILSKSKIFNREEAEKALQFRNINLILNSTVQEISKHKILILNDAGVKELDHNIVIWTAGVKPSLSFIDDKVKRIKERILVNEKFQIDNFFNSFAIGDISIIKGMEDLPLTAQVAIQEGKHLAKNLDLLFQEKDLLPFEFQDNGEMISLGIGEASISALGVTLSGKFAFEARRLIYASKMPAIGKSLKSTFIRLFQKKSILNQLLNKTP